MVRLPSDLPTLPGITVISSDPGYDREKVAPGVEVVADAPAFFRQSATRRAVKMALYPQKRLASVHLIKRAIAQADVVLASGGDVFSSDYGFAFLQRQLAVLTAAQNANRKFVFLGHSIGPFKTSAEVDLIRPTLQASALVTARESFTHKYLLETLGLPEDKVSLTSDVAFLLAPSARERVAALARLAGIPDGEPYVALAPSEGITSFSNAQDRSNHDRAWIETIGFFLQSNDAHVLLIPHVQDTNVSNDDTQIAFRLMEKLGFPARLHATLGPYSAMDYRG